MILRGLGGGCNSRGESRQTRFRLLNEREVVGLEEAWIRPSRRLQGRGVRARMCEWRQPWGADRIRDV